MTPETTTALLARLNTMEQEIHQIRAVIVGASPPSPPVLVTLVGWTLPEEFLCKIEAIKEIRSLTGLGLKEAKHAVERSSLAFPVRLGLHDRQKVAPIFALGARLQFTIPLSPICPACRGMTWPPSPGKNAERTADGLRCIPCGGIGFITEQAETSDP